MSKILTCEHLTKAYGKEKTALNGIDLNLDFGRIVGLLGPNGSGKTTLLKLANGLLQPTEGVVKIAGMIPGPETKEIVSYLPDADWLPDWMRVEELVNMFQDFYGTPCEAKAYIGFDAAKANEMLARLNIDPKARLKTLSKGTKEKVQLVLAMSRAAKLYLLDEPIGGVDPAARDYILNTIISNYSKDATVVISTLNLDFGRIVGLLGPNGSGKTTLLKLANGLLQPTEGVVKIAGMIPGPETKEIVSYLPDADWLPDWMRVEELVNMFQDFYGTPCEAKAYIGFDAAKANEMLARLNIDPKARLKTLSKGTKEKVQLVLAMSRAAKLYLLDEPIGGVDPAARDYILNTIISNYSKDATVVISTHLIEDIEPVLDEAVFLKDGKIFAHRAVDDIRETEGKSVDAYFREVFKC